MKFQLVKENAGIYPNTSQNVHGTYLQAHIPTAWKYTLL